MPRRCTSPASLTGQTDFRQASLGENVPPRRLLLADALLFPLQKRTDLGCSANFTTQSQSFCSTVYCELEPSRGDDGVAVLQDKVEARAAGRRAPTSSRRACLTPDLSVRTVGGGAPTDKPGTDRLRLRRRFASARFPFSMQLPLYWPPRV